MYEYIYPNPIQLQNSINMIGDSIESEKKDAQFYQWLIDNIPAQDLSSNQVKQIKSIIESIRNDELNHNKMFQNMYHQLTGNIVTPIDEEFIPPESFEAGITDALMGELEAVKKYRLIMSGLPSLYYRDIVFNILTDELRHADLYNYIFTNIQTYRI